MKYNLPLLSVVIAVVNGEKSIQKCLDSVTSQTYPNKHVIIMDGASKDSTVDILKANNDKITYWESKPDRGIFHAWNKALMRINSGWVCFLGADDFFANNTVLSSVAMEVRKNNIDVVCSRGVLVSKDGTRRRIFGEPFIWKNLKKRHVICHPGSFYHHRLFQKFGLFAEQFEINGDYEFNLRHAKTSTSVFIDKELICVGDAGLSKKTKLIKANLERIKVHARHLKMGTFMAACNNLYPLCQAILKTLLTKIFPEKKINKLVDTMRKS